MNSWFLVLSLMIFMSLIMIVFSNNVIHSIFWFVLMYLNSSLYILILNQEYMALTLIMVYMGAMTIVFLFVMMMLDILELKSLFNFSNNIYPLVLVILLNCFYQFSTLKKTLMKDLNSWELEEFNNLSTLGSMFYTDYFMLFIFITFLLIVGLVGVIILCLELNMFSLKQNLSIQQKSNNSWI